MAERGRRPYDPYHDWVVGAGRDNFNRLFLAEVRTMADNHSKDADYRRFRRYAVQFIENHYTSHQFDALIPYMAMTFVDRFHLDGQIPTVVESLGHNTDLFLVCCLIISWKLRTKRFVLENFLNDRQQSYFSVENVIDMESRICRKLDWRLRTVMPFWFIDFFAPFLNLHPNPSSALRLVYQLIVKAQFDIAFTEFRPSVIAASAMLIVTSKAFPNQVHAFKNYVINSEFLTPVQDIIHRCSMMLESLYSGPLREAIIDPAPVHGAAPGGASSSAAPGPSDPVRIAATSSTHREGKEKAAASDAEEATDRKGKEAAATDDEEATHHEGEEAAASDAEKATHREGKHPATGEEPIGLKDEEEPAGVDYHEIAEFEEIHPEQERRILRQFQDEDDTNDLMNFKLGWIEAQAEVDNRNLAPTDPDGGYFTTYLSQRFCSCCNIL